MKVLITGGAGFLGSRLARTLLHRGDLSGRPLQELVLTDQFPPPADLVSNPRIRTWSGPLAELCTTLRHEAFDVVFHLAAAVSAECEADLDLGLRSNLDGTRSLLDALRATGTKPRLVFSSSVAVFGGDAGLSMPRVIQDNTPPVPQTSYGIQKFICEQLVADYTRRGLIDGRSVRLTTITVRPGRPNAAASGFFSSIIREPLNGQEVVCPVSPETLAAVASPERAIEGLVVAAEATPDAWGSRTALNLPGLTVTIGEMMAALEIAGGLEARKRVRFEEDPSIAKMILGWPFAIESTRARGLGLLPDPDFLSIVRQFQKEQAV
jgi:nucleoside-diphosphate-sugar epimerase